MSFLTRLLRAGEGRTLRQLETLAAGVNRQEEATRALSDAELRAKTDEFRRRLAEGETVDDLEAEAFAVVRETARRTLGQRHFDVQVIGAGALHRGMIAEMKTGEGKTLAATMPVYLNALAEKGVHVVTVNDYLARRDAEWMGEIYRFLGLEVGLIQSGMTPDERRPAYAADVTYGTNNEFGFDYLRDNMAMRPADQVQRGHDYAIVDEVDSILVDEARTPLIISGRVADTAKWYKEFARIADRLRRDAHYEVDEKKRQVITTEEGVARVEELLGIENMFDFANVDLVHHLDAALKAKELYQRDVDYLISHGEVKIVDEFTGRVLEGRRYSEGLHQAIEAKEGVAIKDENQTLAAITLQNYFRMYEKLAGMTGTAKTEAQEFSQIYGLGVVEVPTNEPVIRMDQPDLVYKTEEAKFQAVVDDLVSRYEAGQPVLVGTVSIEKSERLSNLLQKRGIPHEVLNAKHHEREAQIIAQAGRLEAVTVATNMAGRGVDIMLGGNPEELTKSEMTKQEIETDTEEWERAWEDTFGRFREETAREKEKVLGLGGLYVLATERHESRRIDNQLRGRSGRQGDPGESRFYLSLGDDLMRRFASDRVSAIMERLRIPEDVPIEHKMVTRAVERAQAQVEAQNFEIRKNVLKYDEVMNQQREIVYRWRGQILRGEAASGSSRTSPPSGGMVTPEGGMVEEEGPHAQAGTEGLVREWIDEVMAGTVESVLHPDVPPEDWDWEELTTQVELFYPTGISSDSFDWSRGIDLDEVVEAFVEEAYAAYQEREEEIGPEVIRNLEQTVVLSVIDNKWREHLAEMDYLRQGIGLRAMGQRDPLTEYQREAYDMFAELVASVKRDAVRYLYHVEVARQPKLQQRVQAVRAGGPAGQPAKPRQRVVEDKVGRNDPCPCGSGQKYKRCHGAVA